VIVTIKAYYQYCKPFGDTFRYLDLTENISISVSVAQAIYIFYFPKLLKKLSVAPGEIEDTQKKCDAYCLDAIADLKELEHTLRTYREHKREPMFRQLSKRSQFLLDVAIDCEGCDKSFADALDLFVSGGIGDPRYLLGEAVSAIYYPLASNAFALPINQVVDAIGLSREKFRWLRLEYSTCEERGDCRGYSKTLAAIVSQTQVARIESEYSSSVKRNRQSQPRSLPNSQLQPAEACARDDCDLVTVGHQESLADDGIYLDTSENEL
jgi:hypothetical protein